MRTQKRRRKKSKIVRGLKDLQLALEELVKEERKRGYGVQNCLYAQDFGRKNAVFKAGLWEVHVSTGENGETWVDINVWDFIEEEEIGGHKRKSNKKNEFSYAKLLKSPSVEKVKQEIKRGVKLHAKWLERQSKKIKKNSA